MRIRRNKRAGTGGLALDANDMFLLGLFAGTNELHLLELVELVPGDPIEVMRRLHALAGYGLLDLSDDDGSAEAVAQQHAKDLLLSSVPVPSPLLIELRPTLNPHTATTARPPRPLPIAELFRNAQTDFEKLRAGFARDDSEPMARALRRESFKDSQVTEASEARPQRRENLKATLVDEDSDARARELKRVC